jgi:hypothetical protein
MKRAVLLVSILALAGCRASRDGWGRGSYRVLHESDDLQIRTGRAYVEEDGEHVFLRWAGARAKLEAPLIEEFTLVVFDDRDNDGAPDQGEVLASKATHETANKVMVSAVRVPIGARALDLKGVVTVRTSKRTRTGLWRLIEDPE